MYFCITVQRDEANWFNKSFFGIPQSKLNKQQRYIYIYIYILLPFYLTPIIWRFNYHEHGDLLNSACALLHPRRLQLGAMASLMEAAIYYVGFFES